MKTYLYIASIAVTKNGGNTIITFPIVGHVDAFNSLTHFGDKIRQVLQTRDDYTSSDFLANLTYVCVEENNAVIILRELIISINNMIAGKAVGFN
jgi:hypothetical protein